LNERLIFVIRVEYNLNQGGNIVNLIKIELSTYCKSL